MKKILFSFSIIIWLSSCGTSETKDNNTSKTNDTISKQATNQITVEDKCQAIYPAQPLSVDDINAFFDKGKEFTLQWLCEHSYVEDSNFIADEDNLTVKGEQMAFRVGKNIVNIVLNNANQIRYIQFSSAVTTSEYNSISKDLKRSGYKMIKVYDTPHTRTTAYKNNEKYYEVIKYTSNKGYSFGSYYKTDYNLEQWLKENLEPAY